MAEKLSAVETGKFREVEQEGRKEGVSPQLGTTPQQHLRKKITCSGLQRTHLRAAEPGLGRPRLRRGARGVKYSL